MKKHLKNFSLVISGVVLGVAISFSGEISAATSKLLGGKVGKVMTVSLDDKKIGDAPVIGGTSYVPIRTAANELGLEVAVDGNEIKLTSPEEETQPIETEPVETPVIEEPVIEEPVSEEPSVDDAKITKLKNQIEQVKRKISSSKSSLALKEQELNDAKNVVAAGSNSFVNVVESLQKSYDESKQYITEQEKLLADLESQLAAL